MGKKSREDDLAFVGRHRHAKRDREQKALLERLTRELRDRPPPPEGDAGGAASAEGAEDPPAPLPAWKRRAQTPFGGIPLQPGGAAPPLPGVRGSLAPVDPAIEGAATAEGGGARLPSSNWLGVELGEPHPAGGAAAPQPEDEPVEEAVAPTPLDHLDSVVHDFVASMGQRPYAVDPNGAAPHVESFRRLLESSTASTGQILGPPVLYGASPPMGLESVLGLLGSMRETGVLHVDAGGVTFTISIVKGDVVHGVSRPRPRSELLGNVLVSLGLVDAERLARFFDEHGSTPSTIGEALDRGALVTTDELRRALEHQLRMLFARLLGTRRAVWCFRAGEATLAYIDMRLSVIGVLLESAAKSDERSAG